jgi:hypothetical protein
MLVELVRFVDGSYLKDLDLHIPLADLIKHCERPPYMHSIELELKM